MIPSAKAAELARWVLRRRRRLRVSGPSMEPTLHEGSIVLVDPRAYRADGPHVADVVVARHPTQHQLRIVKRIEAVEADGRLRLVSDNSTAAGVQDSRSFGPIEPVLVEGRVTSVVA